MGRGDVTHSVHRVGAPIKAIIAEGGVSHSGTIFEALAGANEVSIGIVIGLRGGLSGIAKSADFAEQQVALIVEGAYHIVGLMAIGGFAGTREGAIAVGVISELPDDVARLIHLLNGVGDVIQNVVRIGRGQVRVGGQDTVCVNVLHVHLHQVVVGVIGQIALVANQSARCANGAGNLLHHLIELVDDIGCIVAARVNHADHIADRVILIARRERQDLAVQ